MKEEATASNLRGKLITDSGKLHVEIAYAMIMSEIGRREAAEKQVEGLSKQVEYYKGLELSYHTDVKKLEQRIQDKDREIDGLKQTIDELTKSLEISESARSNLALSLMNLESELSDKDTELDQLKAQVESLSTELEKVHEAWQDLYLKQGSHTAEVAYYKQQAKKAEETNVGLREELESLRAQQTQDSDEDKDSHIKVKYTKDQKDRMAEVYKQTFRNKTKTIEILHQEGIDVSYRHLIRILQKRGFKSEKKK